MYSLRPLSPLVRTISSQTWQQAESYLRLGLSPEQVNARLRLEGRASPSKESLYLRVYADKAAGGNLIQYLRCQKVRRKRYGSGQERQECLALVYCTMLMLGQKIARTEDGRVPRAAAKRAARVGLPNDTVRCITLRREQILGKSGEPDTGQAINYSHRFMVRGHWKPQWYPSLQDHRIIYIAPYIKGPDDKPLIIRDTVYALKR